MTLAQALREQGELEQALNIATQGLFQITDAISNAIASTQPDGGRSLTLSGFCSGDRPLNSEFHSHLSRLGVFRYRTSNDEARQHPDFEHLQQQFVKEAFKLARCNHPHIVSVQELFQEDSLWCIPIEYLAGMTLDKRDRRILPEDEALRYVRQIGEALIVVHQNQLLHRDVRPENIMLRIRNGQSEAVLIDFGLARDVDHQTTQTGTGANTENQPFHKNCPEYCCRVKVNQLSVDESRESVSFIV